MSEARKGMLAMIAAATVWGLSGLYYKALAEVPPVEVLCHRTVWTVIFFGGLLAVQGRIGESWRILAASRAWGPLMLSAAMIATNWLLFITAVQRGYALEASLGYYMFPLFAVALGFLVFGERFSRLQAVAIGMAAAAVGVLTAGLGYAPWAAVVIAATFAAYGLVKKRIPIGSMLSVFAETSLLAPLALVWLLGLHTGAWNDLGGRPGGYFGHGLGTSLMLAFSGVLTGGPLMLFSYSARRIPYATLGLVQYLNPTLQVVVAVAAFGEPFTGWHAIAFALIWGGLALYSWASWRRVARVA
ncbi:MAG: EamA family transporter RarD [Amaricoccus sp.]